jgi:hypothetical protein
MAIKLTPPTPAQVAALPPELQGLFHERAGIREHCGKMEKGRAEALAWLDITPERLQLMTTHGDTHDEA